MLKNFLRSEVDLKSYLTDESRDLLDFIYDAVYIVGLDYKIQYWSKGAEKLTGFKAEEVMGRFCKDNILNHTDDKGRSVCRRNCPLKDAINLNTAVEHKFFLVHKNGERIPISTHVGPVKNSNGKIIGAIEVFRDISLQVKFENLQTRFDKLIRQYVSTNTYDTLLEIVSKDSKPVVKNRDLTVFFIDIVGFTTLTENHTAAEIVEMLNLFFSTVSWHIIKNNGDIDKFIGDCAMAVYIHPEDAINTALDILNEGLTLLNNILKKSNFPDVNVRIGINSGLLIQGDIGSEFRKDHTVIGDVVNTASRVQGAADIGNFIISESTYLKLHNKADFEFTKEILLKGKAKPVKLYSYKKKPLSAK